jgi:hypothetical protein
MTPLVPSITERGEIGVSAMTGPAATFSTKWLLVFQHAIDTAGADPDHACNLLSSVASAKQLPDLLVATNALGMAVPALPFDLQGNGCLGSRKCLSSQLLCHFFEQTLLVTKELLQGLGKILLQMQAVDNAFGLRSAGGGGFAEELTTITRDHVHLGMVPKPGGTRLHRTLREPRSYPPLLEVDQDRAVVPTRCATRL